MLKIIHSKFQLDLSNYEISIIEQNHWFSDQFFTKHTLPFNFKITDELNAAMGDVLNYNSSESETYFKVYFYHNGEEYEAIFELEEFEDRDATGSVSFGLEELPNYNKKLSELPLENIKLQAPATIYTHAATIITKTWPEVTHNFVQAHTDKFEESNPQWAFFEGIVNKKTLGGSFVVNSYDAVNDNQLNKNIMIPQPYFLHVLSKGMEDAGYTLAGDVLTDVDLKKALFSEIAPYYYTINTDSQEMLMHSGESFEIDSYGRGRYLKQITITQKGRYKIAGNITMRHFLLRTFVILNFNNQEIYKKVEDFTTDYDALIDFTFPININVDYFSGPNPVLEFVSTQYPKGLIAGEYVDNRPILDLTITQLSKQDTNGNLLPTLITPNDIKLNKCVPDITFGDYVKVLKNWKNLDLIIDGSTIYMNYIEKQLDITEAKSLQDFEVRHPKRQGQKGKSFLLKFQKVTSDDYIYDEVFVDTNGSSLLGYKKLEDTSEIMINALPLPILNRSGVITAHHFVDNKSKIKALLYAGAPAQENLAESPTGLLIPSIYENHYREWFSFRINGQVFVWNFKMYEEQLRYLTIRDKVFAYKSHHIIKTLNKDLISPGIWLVEIETESLKHTI